MLRFILRRVAQMALVMLLLSMLLFLWLRHLPGGPVSAMCGERCTPEREAAIRQLLGMNDPIWSQYLRFLKNAVTGDFGYSTRVKSGYSVMNVIGERFPATIELSVVALTLALITAIPLGYFAARRRGGILDNLSIVASLVGIAVPVFFVAFVLKQTFAVDHHIFPVSGRQDDIEATRVTGFFVLDGIITREWDAAWNAFEHLILPGIALATIPFAVIFRITRASVLEVLDEDYVRTAEAKGLTSRVITVRHVLRNAMIPVVTTIGLQTGALLGGAVLTETVFSLGGLGEALSIASREKDFAVLQALVLLAAAIYVVVNLLVDIAYAFVDPRLRVR